MLTKTFAFLTLILIGVGAQAQTLTPFFVVPPLSRPTASIQEKNSIAPSEAPQPATPFNFKVAKQLWDAGIMPSEQDTIGSWNSIGWADVSMSFAGQKNFYDTAGFKNSDNSVRGATYAWGKDVLGQNQYSIKYLNLGSVSVQQGPYIATVNKDQKAVVSSRFAYSPSDILKSYYEFACRLTAQDSDVLICAITLHIDASEKSLMPGAVQAFDNVMGGMELYKRVR